MSVIQKKSKKKANENKAKKDDFLIDNKKISETKRELVFKVPTKEFNKFYKQALQELSKDLKVAGFRKGKVPAEIAEKELGPERVLYYAGDLAIRKIYVSTIVSANIPAIGEPKIDLKKIKKGEDLEFTATVELLPEVKLKDYQKEIDKINKKFSQQKIEVSEEDIKKELEILANQRAKLVTVNREAQKGDQVEVDFDVFLNKVLVEGGSARKQPVVIGANRFIPGFEEQLIGLAAGDKKEFELTFPKDYHAKHLAGKKATFKVKVNLVQERILPDLDDEFAKSIGQFKSLAELKENIKQGLEHELVHKKEDQWKKELIEALITKSDFPIPDVLIEDEIKVMMRELENDLMRMGLNKEQYFQQVKTSEEKLKEQWRQKQAPDRVKAALILKHLAEKNKLEPDKKEIQEKVNQILQQQALYGRDTDKLDVQRIYEAVKGSLANEKVFTWLMGGEKNVHQCQH